MPPLMSSSPAKHAYARIVAFACLVSLFATGASSGATASPPAPGRAVALAADDFDGDGVADLACGYAVEGGGAVEIARGDVRAIFPGPDRRPATPFFPAVRTAVVPVSPDLVAAGDFDADGRPDLVATARGADALYFLAGDGRGGFAQPRTIPLPGRATALTSGDVNRIDGLADLAVAVDGAAGPRLLVFEGPNGAVSASAESVGLPAAATALAIGRFDRDAKIDVAAAAGSDVVVVHGRDRLLVAGDEGGRLAPAAEVEVRATGRATKAADLEALRIGPSAPDLGRRVIAAVPMRLNADAIDDFAVFELGASAPSFVLSQPAATFVVTTAADSGPGSLRDAIGLANASQGADTIRFAIPGSGVHTIPLQSELPDVKDPVTIDATTQPGYSGTPLVEIDGSSGDAGFGIHVLTGESAIRGLAIGGFPYKDVDGTGFAIWLENGGENIVEACFLGTNAAGTADRANAFGDIYIYESAGNLVGGRVAEARNIISGSCQAANVYLNFSDRVTDNRIEGNYIGTDVTGAVDLNATGTGVFISDGVNNIVGGSAEGARNVISGNGGDFNGFDVSIQGGHDNLVQGNYIGTDASGTASVMTSLAGGILLDGAAVDNMVGGTAGSGGNVIGFNYFGIQVGEYNGVSTGNSFLGNLIGECVGSPIGLGTDYVTPNDAADGDSGPNDFQNFPSLLSAIGSDDSAVITGRLSSTPNAAFRIELFANTGCNASGFGPGERFLGVTNVTTGADGAANFEVSLPVPLAAGESVTATATNPNGSTSEFSMCIGVDLAWDPPDANSSDPMPPPRNLTAQATTLGLPGSSGAAILAAPRDGVTGYKIYRSTSPGVQPTPENFFTSVPPNTTTASATLFVGGTFFVITATYENGESDPSNEVEMGVPPTISSVKAKGSKVTAKGSGFTDSVLVTVDGIPFRDAAAVKSGGRKVVQRGVLLTGETVADYARSHGGTVTVLFRNSTGGTDGRRVTVPR